MRRFGILRAVLAVGLFSALAAEGAPAAKPADDRGGVLYLTLAPDVEYVKGGKYCGRSAHPAPAEAMVSGGTSAKPQIAYLMAAWPDSAKPELGAVTFGLRYSDGIEILRWGACQNVLQAGTSDWPSSGEGMAIAMSGHIDSSRVVELGWFAILAPEPGKVEVIPHPNPQFASRFATARNPQESPIADLGVLGFGEPGRVPIMEWPGPAIGAACVRDSVCAMLTELEAGYYGEKTVWFGAGTRCSWELCRPDAPLGACCFPDSSCERLRERDCYLRHGTFQGEGSRCEPDNPCLSSARKPKQEGGK
jgi:hypothetical protein